MITMTARALAVMDRSFVIDSVRCESWLGDELLADDIPVITAAERDDASISVPERISLTIPKDDGVAAYNPYFDRAPLAANGQRLKIEVGLSIGQGEIEWVQRGWFLIESSETNGDVVTVTAVGLLRLIHEARFSSPYNPSGTFSSTVINLIEPALTAAFSPLLVDRNVPASLAWDEDRLGGLKELLDAWPAEMLVDNQGVLQVFDPALVSQTPVVTLTVANGGTAHEINGSTTRDGAYTHVVARGYDSNGATVQGVAFDKSGGALTYGGPFNPIGVPFFFFSPLLNSPTECKKAAKTVLTRLRRNAARRFTVEAVPNYSLTLGDPVTLPQSEAVPDGPFLCVVDALNLPLNGVGPMSLIVRVV